MKTSNFLSLNWLDVGKGAIVAVLVFLLNYAQESYIPSLDISPEIKLFIITAIGYLLKNFFTPKAKEVQATDEDNGLVGGRPDDRK